MLVHKLGPYPTRFHRNGEVPPYTGPEPFASRLERIHARGTHAITYTNLAPNSHTYARDTCKFLDDSDVIVDFLRRNPDDLRASDRLPLDILLTGVARRSSLLFCV